MYGPIKQKLLINFNYGVHFKGYFYQKASGVKDYDVIDSIRNVKTTGV